MVGKPIFFSDGIFYLVILVDILNIIAEDIVVDKLRVFNRGRL